MKKLIPFAFALAFAIPATAQVASDPVGYISLGNTTSGAPAVAANSEITFSVPLLRAVSASITVASVAGDVITADSSLTADQFTPGATTGPFVAEVTSGAAEGLFVLVVSNDDSGLTLTPGPADDLSLIVAGDTIAVREASTLSNFLGTDFPDNLQVFAYDGQQGSNISPSTSFVFFGGNWFDGLTGDPADNAVLFPGESYLLFNATDTAIDSIVVTGTVPLSQSRIAVSKENAGEQDTRIAYVSPVSEPIGESGIGSIMNDNDQIFVYDNSAAGVNKSPVRSIVRFGNDFFDGLSGDNVNTTFFFEGGEGYILRRGGNGTGVAVSQDAQTYSSGL